MDFSEIVPLKLKKLALASGGGLYVVGGTVRDFIAGLKADCADWDLSGNIRAEALEGLALNLGFSVTAVYKNTGTVRLEEGGVKYEFTSFRTDKYVRGYHSPEGVYFTDDIGADARRRDFCCNAVYYDIAGEKFVDPTGQGIADIEAKRLTTVAPPEKVFGEDGLRLMRLARIAAQTGFEPTVECLGGAKQNAALVKDIAPERVFAELDALLHADLKYGASGGQYRGLSIMRNTGVLGYVLPELAAGEGMAQRSDYHNYDVLTHSLRCVYYAPADIRFAALLHDVGKPYCLNTFGKYARHEEYGEGIAREILSRLRAPKKLTEEVAELVRWHMYDLSLETSERKVRRFMVAHLKSLENLIALKQADFSACKDDLSEAPCVKKWKSIYANMLAEGVPLTLKELKIKGDELIRAGISPDQTGKTLNFLLGECAAGNVKNGREELIKLALGYARGRG